MKGMIVMMDNQKLINKIEELLEMLEALLND